MESNNQTSSAEVISEKSRAVAAILALFLGTFGAHRIYLGKNGSGFTCLILAIVSIFLTGIVIGFIIIGILSLIAVIDFFRILFGGFRDGNGAKVK